jgi:hypothetical protein
MTALDDHLITALQMAVPLHIEQLRHLDPEQLAQLARDQAVTVGTHGDDLQYGGRHCADAFNALARGLAAAALTAWGGVTIAGAHWCPIRGCPGPQAPHPEPTTWAPRYDHRPVDTVHLPEGEAA